MPNFIPDPGKKQDTGGVFTDGNSKINQYQDLIQDLEAHGDHESNEFCKVCIVDETGTLYSQNGDNCWIIPQNTISISGIDICAFIAANCPAIDTVTYNAPTDTLVFTDQNGGITNIVLDDNAINGITLNLSGTNGLQVTATDIDGNSYTDNVVLPAQTVVTSGCIEGDGTAGDPIRFSPTILTINAGTTAVATDNVNGEEGVGCGDLIHFWSADGSIQFNVTPGSAVINGQLVVDPASTELNVGPSGLQFIGNLTDCCPSGLVASVSGADLTITLTSNNGTTVTDTVTLPVSAAASGTVLTTGCVTGDGSIGTPLNVLVDPNGNIICGPSGLAVSGVDDVSITAGNLPVAAAARAADFGGFPLDFNNVDNFGIDAGSVSVLTSDFNLTHTNNTLGGLAVFHEGTANGTDGITLRAPGNLAASIAYTLPGLLPTASGQILTSDPDGVMYWDDPNTDCCLSGLTSQVIGQNVTIAAINNAGASVQTTFMLPLASGGTVDTNLAVTDLTADASHVHDFAEFNQTWNNLQNHTKSFTIAAFPNNSASAVQTFTQQNFTVTNTGVVGGIELDANDPQLFKDDGGGNRASFTVQNGGVGAALGLPQTHIVTQAVDAGTATVGQVLTLNALTGEAEFADPSNACCTSGVTLVPSGGNLTITITDNNGNTVTDTAVVSSATDCCISGLTTVVVGGSGITVTATKNDTTTVADTFVLPVDGVTIQNSASGLTAVPNTDCCTSGVTLALSGVNNNLTVTVTDNNGMSKAGNIDLGANTDCCISGLDAVVVAGSGIQITATKNDTTTVVDTVVIPVDGVTIQNTASGLTAVPNTDCCTSGVSLVASGTNLTIIITDNDGSTVNDTTTTIDTHILNADLTADAAHTQDFAQFGQTWNNVGSHTKNFDTGLAQTSVATQDVNGHNFTADNTVSNSEISNTATQAQLAVNDVANSASISIQDGTVGAAAGNPQVHLNTNSVDAATATNGQVFTLTNAATGEGEWVDPSNDCCTSGVALTLAGSGLTVAVTDNNGNVETSNQIVLPPINTGTCINGNGYATPLELFLDPNGGLECTVSGLRLGGSGCSFSVSTENSPCPPAPVAPNNPNPSPTDGTVQLEYYDDCVNIWSHTGVAWQLDKQISFAAPGISGLEMQVVGTTLTTTVTDTNNNMFADSVPLPTASGTTTDNHIMNNSLTQLANQTQEFGGFNQVWNNMGDFSVESANPVVFSNSSAAVPGAITLNDADDSHFVTLRAAPIAVNQVITFPPTGPGATGDILVDTDGLGTLAWQTPLSTVNTSGCVVGDGSTGNPVTLNLNTTSIICGVSGLETVGVPVTVSTSGCITGDGTVGDPIRPELHPEGGIECTVSGLAVSFNGMAEFAQVGAVQPDPGIASQSRFHVPTGRTMEIISASVTLGTAATTTATVEFHEDALGAATVGGTAVIDTLNITAGNIYQDWAGLAGQTFTGPSHLQKLVTAGNGTGQDLSIQILYRMT